MRFALIFALLFGASAETSAQSGPQGATADAASFVGHMARLCGPVRSTRRLETQTFLNFDAPFPDQRFTVVLRGAAHRAAQLPSPPQVHFADKRVCAVGLVQTYRGTPQIVVESLRQVELESATPAPATSVDQTVPAGLSPPAGFAPGPVALALLAALLLVIVATLHTRRRRRVRRLQTLAGALRQIGEGDSLQLSEEYVAESEYLAWRQEHESALSSIVQVLDAWTGRAPSLEDPERALCDVATHGWEAVEGINAAFLERRLAEEERFFDEVESHPLTKRQRLAVVRNDDNNLVNAGAGSGKTSVVMARVRYLRKRELDRSGQILVLAFARKAKEELVERLGDINHDNIKISTFHALGLELVAEAQGRKPPISRLAEDPVTLERFIAEALRDFLLGDRTIYAGFRDFFTDYLDEADTTKAVRDAAAFAREERSRGLRSLEGVLHKSRDEVAVANWLTLNSVRWEYERSYPFAESSENYRDYQPDFYLPDYDIYIEHWALNREGEPRPGIDRLRYLRGMEWKRQLHQKHETTLFETESWMRSDGSLSSTLREGLGALGVEFSPLRQRPTARIITLENRLVRGFVGLLTQFLNLLKANGLRLEGIRESSSVRDKAFLYIFEPLLDRYNHALKDEGAIDFHDMINRATEYVGESQVTRRYSHIIVDEFQDISESRLGLIKALQRQTPGCRLVGVGDDWQSIYRFAGADVGIITGFGERVGHHTRTDLDLTFRFGQSLAEVSSKFICRNPNQLEKSVRGATQELGDTPIALVSTASSSQNDVGEATDLKQAFHTCLKDALALSDSGGRLAVLGRYHFSRPSFFDDFASYAKTCGMDVVFLTAHASKGLEADFVIVVGLEAATYGFPSGIAEDPVLRMVTPGIDAYPNSEERRLMYVSMTRARKRAYLIYPRHSPSEFVSELREPEYEPYVAELFPNGEAAAACPLCGGNTIREAAPAFYACSAYPLCEGRLPSCPACQAGPLSLAEEENSFVCAKCGHDAIRCPRCSLGYLVARTSAHGEFLGCREWRADGTGCAYTRSATGG